MEHCALVLLIHHGQPQALELRAVADQRVGAHNNVDVARRQPVIQQRARLALDRPSQLQVRGHGQAAERHARAGTNWANSKLMHGALKLLA